MRIIPTALLACLFVYGPVSVSVAVDEPFEKLGAWSNVTVSESEDPHATGFQLDLWTHGPETVGVLSQYVGPVADPPIGELENVVFNSETGQLGFEVRMSVGMIQDAGGEWIPSNDAIGFLGRLEEGEITGDLIRVPTNTVPPTPEPQELTLKPLPPDEGSGRVTSYERWRAWLDEALADRGPKW